MKSGRFRGAEINRRHQTSCCALTKLAHSRSPAETSPWNIQMAQQSVSSTSHTSLLELLMDLAIQFCQIFMVQLGQLPGSSTTTIHSQTRPCRRGAARRCFWMATHFSLHEPGASASINRTIGTPKWTQRFDEIWGCPLKEGMDWRPLHFHLHCYFFICNDINMSRYVKESRI